MSATTVYATISDVFYRVTLNDGAHQWLADEPMAIGGADTGPTPSALLLSSLGSCTAITLIMYATRKRWPLTGVEVALNLNPDGVKRPQQNDIVRQITLQGALSDEQRERLLQVASACPIHKILTGEIHITSRLQP